MTTPLTVPSCLENGPTSDENVSFTAQSSPSLALRVPPSPTSVFSVSLMRRVSATTQSLPETPISYTSRLFAAGSPYLVADGIIECPDPECGAPCNSSDISDDGYCRYCGSLIPLPGVAAATDETCLHHVYLCLGATFGAMKVDKEMRAAVYATMLALGNFELCLSQDVEDHEDVIADE